MPSLLRSEPLQRAIRALRTGLAGPAALVLLLAAATAARGEDALPSFAELEAAGATIGEIHIVTRNVFDLDDPKEDKLLFRWANALHVRTRPGVVHRALLFKPGEPVSVRLIDETERVLRNSRYIYDVRFRPVAYRDGVVDIEVEARDSWTLDVGVSAGRSGGSNSSGMHIKDDNLLGTGMSVGYGRSNNVDRSSDEFEFAKDRAFGSWTSISVKHASNTDGQRNAVSVGRPFYALDSRWAAGVALSDDDRIDALYRGGEVSSQYRHRQQRGEVFGGWSAGLVDGWVHRFSAGIDLRRDRYALEPGRIAPPTLTEDQTLIGPFLRVQSIEDAFDKVENRDLIGRPEFFALGLSSSVQLGWASRGLGSTRDAWLYSAAVSRGFEPSPGQTLTAAAALSGQVEDGAVRRQHIDLRVRYFRPQGKRWLFYAAASGDVVTRPEPEDLLMLGGDNGLRGYPLRYQSGERRALFTVEERFYTSVYLWQLFRIGGAAFFDTGRAWGGSTLNAENPGWLSNAGFGLRFVSARASFSNVLHTDVAFPLNAAPDAKRVQFLVKTKTTF